MNHGHDKNNLNRCKINCENAANNMYRYYYMVTLCSVK